MTALAQGVAGTRIGAVELSRALGQELPPTPEQVAVIEAELAPLLVVAGAGSGKTETMAARVVYLIANGLVRPDQVLGLTFTRKASAQLLQRIRRRLSALAKSAVIDGGIREQILAAEPEVWTYHAFGGRLIAEYGALVGVEPAARILSDTGSWQLASSVVRRWDRDLATDLSPDRVTERLLSMAGVLADHLRTPAELDELTAQLAEQIRLSPPGPQQSKAIHSGLAALYQRLSNRTGILPLVDAFRQAKRNAGVLDFGDQMQLAADLACGHSRVGLELRDRHRVVLLDEYQDTGHSQRVILTTLFGAESTKFGHPVTAVGDPCQSIYSWRGASASNLPRFVTDFPRHDGAPAQRVSLLTSFRNPADVLCVANAISEPIRMSPVPVDTLKPRTGAAAGKLAYGLFNTSIDEDIWIADTIAAAWQQARESGKPPPTTAVLYRRRSAMAPMAELLSERGLPVEIAGLAGLLAEPEIIDLVSMLHVLVDPAAGGAAIRVLTGARWRLGLADVAALNKRAAALAGRTRNRDDGVAGSREAAVRSALAQARPGDELDKPSLVDAVSDPGEPANYSTLGWSRIRRLGQELKWLRSRLNQPLTDLVADIERTIGLDIEAPLAGPAGRAHLDAFAEVVADFVGGSTVPHQGAPDGAAEFGGSWTIQALDLLAFLKVAAVEEDGLAPGEVEQLDDAVQLLTVHAAKGLEWELVAVPQLSNNVFPGAKGLTWLSDDGQLPPSLRGDKLDLPQLEIAQCANQSEIAALVKAHQADWKLGQLTEERRLLYVALTRSEHTLLFSGHWWPRAASRFRGPSEFLTELAAAAAGICPPVCWESEPAKDAVNPLTILPRSAAWPWDPLGTRRVQVGDAADRVWRSMRELAAKEENPAARIEVTTENPVGQDPRGWARDIRALVAERLASHHRQISVELPTTLSVSALVTLADDPARLAQQIRRPLPLPPTPMARRGTAFHSWLERFFAGEALLDLSELPGADHRDTLPELDFEQLREAFLDSTWAQRVPHAQEVPFATMIGDLPVRGRMDAVFKDDDGGWTVVDWKTGRRPDASRAAVVAVQLAAYRLAWANIVGCEPSRVRAAFHYVAANLTVAPADLLDEAGLIALIEVGTGTKAQDEAVPT